MSKPQKELTKESYLQEVSLLFEVLCACPNNENFKDLFKDLLTNSELRMLKRRWHIARLLDRGYDVRLVAKEAGVSSGTVMQVKRTLARGRGGLARALAQVREKAD